MLHTYTAEQTIHDGVAADTVSVRISCTTFKPHCDVASIVNSG